MIAIAIICLAVIASTSSQQISQNSGYNGPAVSIINSPEFKRYLTMKGLKPLDSFNPDDSPSQEKPNPAQILESLQKSFNASRDELYESVDNYLVGIVREFKEYIINFLGNIGSFVEQNQYELGNNTIKAVDQALQAKYASFVSDLMLATDNAVEDYNTKVAAITQKLERKLAELNERAEAALGGGNNGATPVLDTQKPTNNRPSTFTDFNDSKINLHSEGESKLRLPDI
ncbi:uncharacterized protein LOC123261628 [Cotesia glomerata]|uniref:Uncharacterized protein n=1 Tax=Cotesia glomerata TaxID=32391 RepID=A0AAV7I967_COTGL|nr:uncharacterized protein LOC123261628 [Cotesia glomerata]KAH0548836.1 hypothetical protein KQX54_003043 [Cotesia glomerata]